MAEILGIVGSMAGLITLAANTSSLLTSIRSPQTQRLAASLNDLTPVLRCILHTLSAHNSHSDPYPTTEGVQLLAAPVVALYAVLHRLQDVLHNPGHWWERRERREMVNALVVEIEGAKTNLILAFGVVNWYVCPFSAVRMFRDVRLMNIVRHALEALGMAMATLLEGQQRLAASGATNGGAILSGMLMGEETRLRVEAEMDGMLMDAIRRAAARTVISAATIAFFF
ncbi:hypothetical protein EDC01DRAFT_683085 [Geopyxis carbonaria]|nr:hypothetical protein EDC01DRAFT_683085 [Geopyxis carbonaria]